MCHRTVLATAAILNFLRSQPGEFTVEEILELATGFHCDNDEDDVMAICSILVNEQMIGCTNEDGYIAFSA
jgi:hypothetical protein